MGDELKEENAFFCVSGRLTVSPSSCWRKGSAGLNWLSNSHRRPFTQSALSYFSWNMNRWRGRVVGKKTQLLLPFHMSSPSCRSIMPPPPQPNFLLAQRTQVSRILLPKPCKIIKSVQHYRLLFFFPLLIFNKNLSPGRFLLRLLRLNDTTISLWSKTFCFTCFSLPRLEGLNCSQPPTISLKSQQNEAQLCTVMHNTAKGIFLDEGFSNGSHPRQQIPPVVAQIPSLNVLL